MQRTIILLTEHDPAHNAWQHLGVDIGPLLNSFHADVTQLAAQIRSCTLQTVSNASIPAIVAATDSNAPVVMLTTTVPHLPLARIHDAFTRLDDGADLVVGPCDNGSWYLLGFNRVPDALRDHLPPPGEPIVKLLAVANAAACTLTQLPPWYRVTDITDLERLYADLRTMPSDIAPHTRSLLLHAPQARSVGN